jgi:hypothetical protein
VDQLGVPPIALKHDIRLKAADQLQPDVCRVVVNGLPCPLPAQRRGLCARHYVSIWQRPDLRVDDFAAAPVSAGDFRVRKHPVPGVCRIVERGTPCEEPPHGRGLCKRHYSWLRENDPAAFERLAERDRQAIHYTLRLRLRPDRCRVAEDGKPCGEKAYCRGLCAHHYAVLFDNRPLFDQVALPARKQTAAVFEAKGQCQPGTCHLLENGVACTAPAEHRGLCLRHYRRLRSHRSLRLADFLLPERQPLFTLKPVGQRDAGLCRVLVDGEPCQDSAFGRGLCSRHLRVIQKLGRVEELGAPARAPGGHQSRIAHAYLDKNILFDWCDAEAFQVFGQQASCLLVERVRTGRMVATISGSAVLSAYNHLRYRAARPVAEGGQGLEEEAAERLSRETVQRLLEGSWRILALAPHELRFVLRSAAVSLSFEDALEWAAYQEARRALHGPRWFVTRDGDFPEGIRPWALEEHLGRGEGG